MRKKKTNKNLPEKPNSPISDWLDTRSDKQAYAYLTGLAGIFITGLVHEYNSFNVFGTLSREFLIGLPIGALFLSVALLSRFEIEYNRKMLLSALCFSFSILLSIGLAKLFGYH
ncbi:hypothetical protein JNL27_10815 [bacterium]|nr:hypothetical protein [bacterium]